MTDQGAPNDVARYRWFAMVGTRLGGVAGALVGLMLVSRSVTTWQTVLGGAIVLSALLMIAVVPSALARRWRTPPE